MKKVDLISSIVLLALSMAALLESSKLPFGSIKTPKMGFLPLILAIALTIFSLILLGQAIKEKRVKGLSLSNVESRSWKRIGLTVGALFAYPFFFEHLGYKISTFLLIAFLLKSIEPQKWWLTIVVALLSSLLSYLIFGVLLNIPFPTGKLGV